MSSPNKKSGHKSQWSSHVLWVLILCMFLCTNPVSCAEKFLLFSVPVQGCVSGWAVEKVAHSLHVEEAVGLQPSLCQSSVLAAELGHPWNLGTTFSHVRFLVGLDFTSGFLSGVFTVLEGHFRVHLFVTDAGEGEFLVFLFSFVCFFLKAWTLGIFALSKKAG